MRAVVKPVTPCFPSSSKGLLMKLLRIAFFALWFAVLAAPGNAATAKKPNIVVLIADDLGVGDIGFSGGKDIPTPNLDRLAREGVIFRNGYVSSMCAPTRVAL